MEGMIGEVRIFGGTFAPKDWAFCNGQVLAISSNDALFSILGTIYGGDGRTTFALPDLRSRAAIGPGTGPGLPTIRLGESGGRESTTLSTQNLPAHTHALNSNNAAGTSSSPQNNFPAVSQVQIGRGGVNLPVNSYGSSASPAMNPGVIGNTGGSTPIQLRNPFMVCHYIICLFGVYPSES
jgi:microcystin-dependent protein